MQRYLARVSGPLLDRIDIHLEVPAVKYRALADQGAGEPSEAIRERVDRARVAQRRACGVLDGAAELQPKHVSEAIQYRSLDRRGLG